MKTLETLTQQDLESLETKAVWRALTEANRYLAELKGLCESLPNPDILIETLSIQEAKDSSEIENIITTHDELYIGQGSVDQLSSAAKEVQNYVAAMHIGFDAVNNSGLIRLDALLSIQSELEKNDAGIRRIPGTVLRNETTKEVVYEPPQDSGEIERLLQDLLEFIHADDDIDPLLRMAIAHHQFESIHPFYDGNGRTGRILAILMLIREGLLKIPVLYLSRYITTHKSEYYRLLQAVREDDEWEEWCLYMIKGVSLAARSGIQLIGEFRDLMMQYKHEFRRKLPKIYHQGLLNNLFRWPYTKIEYVERELKVSRPTATRYLDKLAEAGFVRKKKFGRCNFYINEPLFRLLSSITLPSG